LFSEWCHGCRVADRAVRLAAGGAGRASGPALPGAQDGGAAGVSGLLPPPCPFPRRADRGALAGNGARGGPPQSAPIPFPPPPTTGAAGHSPKTILLVDRNTVQLNLAAYVTDVALFEAACRADFGPDLESAGPFSCESMQETPAAPPFVIPNEMDQAEQLARAVGLYRGELLPGYFEDWIVPERQRLAELHLQALGRLLALAERERGAGGGSIPPPPCRSVGAARHGYLSPRRGRRARGMASVLR
jgi:hypothetical protein